MINHNFQIPVERGSFGFFSFGILLHRAEPLWIENRFQGKTKMRISCQCLRGFLHQSAAVSLNKRINSIYIWMGKSLTVWSITSHKETWQGLFNYIQMVCPEGTILERFLSLLKCLLQHWKCGFSVKLKQNFLQTLIILMNRWSRRTKTCWSCYKPCESLWPCESPHMATATGQVSHPWPCEFDRYDMSINFRLLPAPDGSWEAGRPWLEC